MLKSITGFFVGENSKKRQLGIIVALILSGLYWQDVITLALYEAAMPLVIIWIGAAFSAKLTKLQKAMIDAKK